ncbi:MAG: HNH endonuclease [Komarekiella atlantica HA4396-MV6]|jgi:5-methylcytosine-specific restriction endonuclease McrA|nr:HNH endonuclease [Komarekiella atlantica HA4396-MV6]
MVSEQTRKFVRQRAKYLCEYCHSPEYLSPDRFTIDHIMPQSLGGSDELDNFRIFNLLVNMIKSHAEAQKRRGLL